MKLEVKRRDNGMVEFHLMAEDGKITVYLCQDYQAAIFKLAQLLFQAGDDPEERRRSILVGTFEKERPKPDLTEEQKKFLEEFKKLGFIKVNETPVSPFVPFTVPIGIDPNVVPITTTPGTGGLPYTITWGTSTSGNTSSGYTTYNNSGQVWYTDGSGKVVSLSEKAISPPVDMMSNSGGDISSCYYVSTTNLSLVEGK